MQILQHELMAEPAGASWDVERLCHAYERLNATGEVPVELFDPDVEYEQPDLMIDSQTYFGLEGLRQALDDMLSSFDSFEMRPTDLIYQSDSEIVVRVKVTARGKGSGAEVGGRFFHVWSLRDGMIVRGQAFVSRAEALDAAMTDTRLPAAA